MAALDDSPRPGKEPTITDAARAWVVSLACQKAKEVGYPHELWTTRLLARHVGEHAKTAGHPCLTRLAQGTVCKILDRHDCRVTAVCFMRPYHEPTPSHASARRLGIRRSG
jgi:hypothetical protein